MGSPAHVRNFESVLARLAQRERRVTVLFEARDPGALIVTPLVQFRTRQRDWVRAAHRVGIGTMACMYSWDSLTNRGLMHAVPDRVAVWNDAQGSLAVELHGARREAIVVA